MWSDWDVWRAVVTSFRTELWKCIAEAENIRCSHHPKFRVSRGRHRSQPNLRTQTRLSI